MSPIASWLLVLSILSGIAFLMTLFYARGQQSYIQILEEKARQNQPPF